MTAISSFLHELDLWHEDRARGLIASADFADVERALHREHLTPEDLAALLSPRAEPYLEQMAQRAHRLTRRFFGRTIGLYAPIYLSNVCRCDCTYCGYAVHSGSTGERRTLTEAEIRAECRALAAHGFQNVLLLTGEAPREVSIEYLCRSVEIARECFPSVSVEIYALDTEQYCRLVECGLEGVTLYMETYHLETYARVHVTGKKKDYAYRLEAIERAGEAGVRRLSIGALLGLHEWRIDGFWTALHAAYLQKKCWRSALSVSFPRLRHAPERHGIQFPMTDRQLVQLMVAMRLFLPEVGFNLSTREPADLRDGLIPLGVTMMSAGSSTRPGGYSTCGEEVLEQFEVEDRRSPAEVAEVIRKAGYEPVWKDFDAAFHEG